MKNSATLLLALVEREKENRGARARPPLRSYDAPSGKVNEADDLPKVVMTSEDEAEDWRMRRGDAQVRDA